MLAEVKERADDFDILHFHLDCLHLPFFENIADKTITTVHGRQDIKDLRELHRHYQTSRSYPSLAASGGRYPI